MGVLQPLRRACNKRASWVVLIVNLTPATHRDHYDFRLPSGQEVKGSVRQKYSVVVSCGYIAAGAVIITRSVIAHVLPVGALGLVFVALGLVRIRDHVRWRRTLRDS
ncbi:MAG: hypothetical protein NVSMB52_04890 [Chloroflexota bacterium]